MPPPNRSTFLARAAFACAFASAATVLFSIAASQIFLALSTALLLLSGERLRIPRMWPPLAAFLVWTVLSLVFSGSPAEGRPQIRKFFVYLTLVAVFSAFRRLDQCRSLVLVWGVIAAVAGGWGVVQFLQRMQMARQIGQNFYYFYLVERISGPMGHWMTYSGLLLMAGLMLAAWLFFSPSARGWRAAVAVACLVFIGAGMVLALTRNVWGAALVGSLYLVWFWRRRLLVALPAIMALILLLAPTPVRTRVTSIFHPQENTDSNQHRIVCWRTGWVMIKQHPILGLGPEIVRRDFQAYVPADIPRPLPPGWYGHLHSVYVHYAAERGIPAVLFLLAMFGKMLWDFGTGLRRLPPGRGEERALLHGAVAVVIATMVSGIFELNLGDSEVLAMFLAVVALGYAALEKLPQGELNVS